MLVNFLYMEWSNIFSYGEDNFIAFDNAPLTQILGKNGHGKSSIGLILEEGLFNKNSKGLKRADILNRYSKAKSYKILIKFQCGSDLYIVDSVRGSTQQLKLLKNGVDISAHTVTATLAMIEEIIGMDHKTFSQIIYQSSTNSLQFLTSTDSVRKKFFIDLLSLEKYGQALDIFKALATELNKETAMVSGRIDTAKEWLNKYSKTSLEEEVFQEEPEIPPELGEKLNSATEQLKTIDSTNRKIIQNNKFKEILDSISIVPTPTKPEGDIDSLRSSKAALDQKAKTAKAVVDKLHKLGDKCPTCLQPVIPATLNAIVFEHQEVVDSCMSGIHDLEKQIGILNAELKKWQTETEALNKYEQYHSLYDSELSTEIVSKADLEALIAENTDKLAALNDQRAKIRALNSKASAHNAKIALLKEQLQEMQTALTDNTFRLQKLVTRQANIQVLVKTFSPSGLVAYKIENLTKDLESLINSYLEELSSGRFQLLFQVESDKLNVVITDNGKDVDILALSSGERARVNTAALLGIRKLLQSLSNSRINLLILDETMENLDTDGKEKLVEVLRDEDYLNTFIISHGYTHPLLDKITVVKEHNISRIES